MRASSGFRAVTAAVGLSFAAALTLTACGSDTTGDGTLTVVASTNVWGSVAQAVAGDKVDVTSIITEPSSDPHSFEASPTDAAKLTDASLIVYNGGGYDHFVDDIIGTGNSDQLTVNAFDLLEGGAHAGEGGGDSHEATTTATSTNTSGSTSTPSMPPRSPSPTSSANSIPTTPTPTRPTPPPSTVSSSRSPRSPTHRGRPQGRARRPDRTDRLLPAAVRGPEGRHPARLHERHRERQRPAPAAIAATRQLLTGKQVQALVYNVQTQDRVTQDVRATAESAGIPVVEVTETLPEGLDYIQWQTNTAESLAAALQ